MQKKVIVTIKEKKTFKQLYDKYYAVLVYYAIGFVNRMDVAEDIVQDLFMYLWEKQMSFDSIESLCSYLYSSTKHSAIDYLRHSAIETKYANDFVNINTEPFDTTSQQEEEIYRLLFKQIDLLPERCKEIFLLHLKGLSNQQIADRLSLSIETVKTQKKRAIQKLKDNLK